MPIGILIFILILSGGISAENKYKEYLGSLRIVTEKATLGIVIGNIFNSDFSAEYEEVHLLYIEITDVKKAKKILSQYLNHAIILTKKITKNNKVYFCAYDKKTKQDLSELLIKNRAAKYKPVEEFQ